MISAHRREILRKANLKWRTINRERHNALARAWQKANPDKRSRISQNYFANHVEAYRQRNQRSYAKCRDELSTGYIRRYIARKTGLKASDVTLELVEAKRSQLKVYRLLKETT